MNEFWPWYRWCLRLIWGIINKMNHCQESDQFRHHRRGCNISRWTPDTCLCLWADVRIKLQSCLFPSLIIRSLNIHDRFLSFLHLCCILLWYATPSSGLANSQCQKGICPGAGIAELLSSAHKGNVAWGGWLRKGESCQSNRRAPGITVNSLQDCLPMPPLLYLPPVF